jgi:type II secretory pathway pseudopilin PulG
LSIAAIVALFTLTNITYQISSQNRTERLDHLQNAVQGQLASVDIRQHLEELQKQILVLDALIISSNTTIQQTEIDKGTESISAISKKIVDLGI